MSAGLYLHYPFCKQKCYYCDFISFTNLQERIGYSSLWQREYALHLPFLEKEVYDTLYIGGGTPSLIPSEEWSNMHSWIQQVLPSLVEFTVEANPESITDLFIDNLEKVGCNRISLGLQSMDDHVLLQAGRLHSSDQSRIAVEKVKKSQIPYLNVDFIVDLPGESWLGVKKNCQFIETYRPDHVSLYFLSIPHSTKMDTLYKTESSLFPDENLVLEWWFYYIRFLKNFGFTHYEISNFSISGASSIHNLHYWQRDSYLGLGVNASSFFHAKRWTNVPTLPEYRQKILSGFKPVAFSEDLTADIIHLEKIMLGLRLLQKGIPLSLIKENKADDLDELMTKKWLKVQDSSILLTERGCLWLDTIIKKLA